MGIRWGLYRDYIGIIFLKSGLVGNKGIELNRVYGD